MCRLFLLIAMWSFMWVEGFALSFRDLSPAAGLPGSVVRLGAAEVPTGAFEVRIGESGVATAATIEGSELVFVVPANAVSGEVFVSSQGGAFETSGFTFRVGRNLPVRFEVPDPAVFALHDVGSTIEDAALQNNVLTVVVPVGETALVVATAEDPEAPQLLAFMTNSMTEAVLSAESTASAMVFFSPGVYTADPVEADLRLAAIRGLSGVVEAAAVAESHLAAGRDFLEDARYEDALVAALTEYSEAIAAEIDDDLEMSVPLAEKLAEDTITENYDFAAGHPRDLPGAINVLLAKKIDPSVDANNIPVRRVNLEGRSFLGILDKKINPLDWTAHAWALDPEQFSGLTQVNSITAAQAESQVYTRLSPVPVTSLSVKSTNVLKNLNLIEVASDALLSYAPTFPPDDGLEFPADRAGIYMVRSYSGAIYPALDPLISSLPEGGDEDAAMKGINVILAVVDFAAVFLPIKTIFGNELIAKLTYTASREVTAAIIREGNEGRAITAEFVTTVFLEVSKGVVKELLAAAVDLGVKAIPRIGKSVAKFLDVLAKVANGGAAVERIAALTNASRVISNRAFFAPSVESTLVVVGDPFAPEVLDIRPMKAHRGRFITLTGRRFLEGQPNSHIVRFGDTGTDPYATSGAGRVILASRDSLVVEVPEAAETGFITVAILDRGVATTVPIADGKGLFTVIPDPVITGVSPSSIIPGGLVRIEGSDFAPVQGDNRVTFSGAATQNLSVIAAYEDELIVQAPSDLVSGTVTVKVGNRTSNAFPLSTVLPAVIPAGGTLFVSIPTDNTAADGELTLREAMLFASGRLGRALTTPPDERPEGVTYETDYVSGTPGAAVRDQIFVDFDEPTTIALSSSLPTFGNFDQVLFTEITLDGSQAGPDALVFDAIRGSAQNVQLINFTGNGVRFTGNALGNAANFVVSVSPELNGALFDGSAQLNVLHSFEVTNAGKNGVELNGAGVRFNRMTRPTTTGPQVNIGRIVSCTEWGVLLTGGTTGNNLAFGDVQECTLGGVFVDADSPGNLLGRTDSSIGIFPRVSGNLGPGVIVEARRTAVRYLNVYSNTGDGILFQGPLATDGVIDLVRVGYDYSIGAAAANQGHGIHLRSGATRILIGRRDSSSFGARTSIAGNRDDGIRVDGTAAGASFVEIKHTHIGLAIAGISTEVSRANGGSGVALINANDCEIGDLSTALDVHINNHTTEGILISGEASRSNYVFNCQIGSHHDGRANIGNAVGIRIAGGAWGNVIGQRNLPFVAVDSAFVLDGKGANVIMNNSDAGIVLASGGDPTTTQNPTDPPFGGNIVIANRIGGPADNAAIYRGNGVGLRVENGARFNRIGGRELGDGNLFAENIQAGIHLMGGTVTGRSVNRILNNIFLRQGQTAPNIIDPLVARPNGVGVLVSGNAKGHVIGSNDPLSGNTFTDNRVGVYTEDSEEITVTGNKFTGNILAGTILRNSQKCVCGPHNLFQQNGNATDPLAAVVLAGGGMHQLWGNEIGGSAPNDPANLGNNAHGITIIDSSNNLIGGPNGSANTIVNNLGVGILVRGSDSSNNQIANNRIGVRGPARLTPKPNTEGGILIDGGAHDNVVGGFTEINRAGALLQIPAGNRIIANNGHGVQVDGNLTAGNTITWNSITDHNEAIGNLGIRLTNGSNNGILPPAITSFEGGVIEGTSNAPNGSLVQVFSDPSDEGLTMLGEAIVNNGEWSYVPGVILYPALTATVTNVNTNSTSEFGARVYIDDLRGPALIVRRTIPGAANDGTIVINRPSALHDFELQSDEVPVRINAIELKTNPDLALPLLMGTPSLYHDTDEDGTASPGDRLLSSTPINTTSGVWRFEELNATIDPTTLQRWLVVATVTTTPGPFQLTIEAATDVDSVILFPGSPLTPTGPFPVPADRFTLVEASESGRWVFY